MKTVVIFLALSAISNVAFGQADCQSITKASDRLACYDKAAPPAASGKKANSKGPSEGQAQVVDLLAAENARLDAKINNICRGC
jgi:hypothetical protein